MVGILKSKRAIVTGGSRGIGRAIVERFAREGAQVLTCGRGERPRGLSDAITWIQLDAASLEAGARLAEAVEQNFGGLDVLVNNAGIQIEKTAVDSDLEDWDSLMNTNARAVFLLSKALIPLMAQSGGGAIVNIGSISGHFADPAMALYNASKAFVHALTRSIAVDHGGQGIRCNAICPGWIMTEMADAAFDLAKDPQAAKRDALARHPVGRFGEPEDIAKAALWLVSDEADFVTGQTLTVDGGLTAASPLQPGLF